MNKAFAAPVVRTIYAYAVWLILVVAALTMILPLVWMVSTALKPAGQLFVHPPQWWPDPPRPDNFAAVWHAVPFGRGFLNSLVVATAVSVGQTATSALAAFGFARMRFRYRDQIFLFYLGTLMVPGAVTMIPTFILMKSLPAVLNAAFNTDWFAGRIYCAGRYAGTVVGLDSYFALIAPGCFSAYGTFLLRQFFMGLPGELEDAGRIDGCSRWTLFQRIALPLSRPALATLVILSFLGSWKSFMWPLVATSSMEMRTVPVMLQAFQSQFYTEWSLLMAASVIALAPVVVVFVLGQRYFVEGLQLGAIKA